MAAGDAGGARRAAARRTRATRSPPRDADRPKGLNVLGTLAHHPALTTAFHTFNGHVLFAHDARRPASASCSCCGSPPSAGADVRVGPARRPGRRRRPHRRGDRARSPTAPTPPGWSPLDARPARAPSTSWSPTPRIADATWAALAAELDDQQLMDVVFTVGAYDLLAMAFRTFGVELDADLAERKRASP